MHIVFTEPDLPFLKQLSYKVSSCLNDYLEREKSDRKLTASAIAAGLDAMTNK